MGLRAGEFAAARAEGEVSRRGDILQLGCVAGAARARGSTSQSLARNAATVQTDYLNGEIVLLGRLHGVATPVNALFQDLMRRAARAGVAPGSMTEAEILQRLHGVH